MTRAVVSLSISLLLVHFSDAFHGHYRTSRSSSFLSQPFSTSRLFVSPEANESSSPREASKEDKRSPSLLRLAELSLKDYDWRSSIFKSTEADRRVEESLARMMGDEPTYVRPMDASEEKIGPLVSGTYAN